MLLERGTNPCCADSHHRTPSLAAQRGHITALCLLEHQGAPAVPPHTAPHLSDTSLGTPPASSAGCSLAVAMPLVLSLRSCPLGTTGSHGHCCPSPHGMPGCTPSMHSSCSWRGQPTAMAARRPCSEGEGVWPSPACAWGQRQGAGWGGGCEPPPSAGYPTVTVSALPTRGGGWRCLEEGACLTAGQTDGQVGSARHRQCPALGRAGSGASPGLIQQQQCRQGLGHQSHPSLTQWGGSPGCSPLPEPSPVGAGTHWWCPGLTLCICLYKNKHCDLLQPCPCPEGWGGWQGAAGGHPSGTGGLGGQGAAGAQWEAGTQGMSALQPWCRMQL